MYGLPDDAFDTFVPKMQQLNAADVLAAAQAHLDPARLVTVVVGDPQWKDGLGESVATVTPEF